ncbi:MAG: hypothetical protein AAFY33_12100 [Cyanobacteria bacterium J06643_4]
MTQLQLDIPDEAAAWLEQQAQTLNLSVSKYVAQLIQQDRKTEKTETESGSRHQVKTDRALEKENGWPEGYFDLLGSGKDDPIERPNQWEHPLKEISL